jgi:hypothetical protein
MAQKTLARPASLAAPIPGRTSLARECQELMRSNSELAAQIVALLKFHTRVPLARWTEEDKRALRSVNQKAPLTQSDSGLGQGTSLPQLLADLFVDLLSRHSAAWRTFLMLNLDASQQIVPSLNGRASAVWYSIANQGSTFLATDAIAGANTDATCGSLGALVEASGEAVADGGPTLAAMILRAFIEGIDYRLSWTCCQGKGVDDGASGGYTGIFQHAAVPTVVAAAGHTTVDTLSYYDLLNLVAAIHPEALSNPCSFIASPALFPKFLKLRTHFGGEGESLLKAPVVPDGAWTLLGFPVVWMNGAPASDGPGDKVIAFGRGEAYVVGMRKQFELLSSDAVGFAKNSRLLKALVRARCEIADAGSFATLALAES